MDGSARQSIATENRLKNLILFHYIWGTFIALFSNIFIIHVIMFFHAWKHPEIYLNNNPDGTVPSSPILLLIISIIPFIYILAGWTLGILTILSGRFIRKRKRRWFSLVIAGINTLIFPFGTILGILTVLYLTENRISQRYESNSTIDSSCETNSFDPHKPDRELLKLLSLFHRVIGGMLLAIAIFIIFMYHWMKLSIIVMSSNAPNTDQIHNDLDTIILILFIYSCVLCILNLSIGTLFIISGKFIRQHRCRTFSLIAAGLSCLNFPLATIPGILTIMCLMRESVKQLYAKQLAIVESTDINPSVSG